MDEPKKDQQKRFESWSNIIYLTQLGLTFSIPMVLCIAGAAWLQNKFDLGGWVIIVGVICGIGGTASSFLEFYRKFSKKARKETKEQTSFNKRY